MIAERSLTIDVGTEMPRLSSFIGGRVDDSDEQVTSR